VLRLGSFDNDEDARFQSAASTPQPPTQFGAAGGAFFPPAAAGTAAAGAVKRTTASTGASSTTVDADAAAALTKLTGHVRSGSKGSSKEIVVPAAPAAVVATTTAAAPAAATTAAAAAAAAAAPVGGLVQSMSERLELVARYSATNLYDALTALCSWASISVSVGGGGANSPVKEHEDKLNAFFRSQALELLLASIFADVSMQYCAPSQEVKGVFRSLLQHLLLPPASTLPSGSKRDDAFIQAQGSSTAAVQQLVEALDHLVRQVHAARVARSLRSFAAPTATAAAGAAADVAGVLAHQVAECIRSLFIQLQVTSPSSSSSSSSSTSSALVGASNISAGAVPPGKDGGEQEAVVVPFETAMKSLDKQLAKHATKSEASSSSVEAVQALFLLRDTHAEKFALCALVRKLLFLNFSRVQYINQCFISSFFDLILLVGIYVFCTFCCALSGN
jgi:hypothetical protein